MEKITGYINFGSSGYTLDGFVNDALTAIPSINTTTDLGIGFWDYYGHNVQVAIPQKTAIACNVGKEAIRQGYSVKFILAGVLIEKLMKIQGFSYNEEIEDEIKKLKNYGMIIIDDIFDTNKSILWKNPDSASLIITAWDIFLREIVSSGNKVVLTSNIPVNLIENKFGSSMYHLIDRNFICLGFFDDVKSYKKRKFDNLFKDMKN
jgi:hypothetical protein